MNFYSKLIELLSFYLFQAIYYELLLIADSVFLNNIVKHLSQFCIIQDITNKRTHE